MILSYAVGLDLDTLHQTLPESLWYRHERRPPAVTYKPSKDIRRYRKSLGNLLPVRKTNKWGNMSKRICQNFLFRQLFFPFRKREQIPLDQANFFSYITFSWVGRYIRKAYRRGLQPDDIPLCSTRDGCDHCSQRCLSIVDGIRQTYWRTIWIIPDSSSCGRTKF